MYKDITASITDITQRCVIYRDSIIPNCMLNKSCIQKYILIESKVNIVILLQA